MRNLLLWATLCSMLAAPLTGGAQSSSSGFSVSGRVNRSPTTPLMAVQRVIMTEASGVGSLLEATPAADGTFRFSRVRPGTYRVQILTNADFSSEGATIQVLDKDVSGVSLSVYGTVMVTWNLVVEGGGLRPPVTLSIAQYRGGQGYRLIGLTEDATEREAVEGEYRVSWTALPAGYFIKSITMGSTDLLTNPMKVDPANKTQRVTVTLGVQSPPPWVKVSGRLASLSPGPLPATMRVALEDSSNQRRTPETAVGADGAFEFPMVLPGTYKAVTSGAPSIQVLGPTSIVVPNSNLSGLQVVISARKEISGKVSVEGVTSSSPPGVLVVVSNRVQSAVPVQPDGTFKVNVTVGTSPFTLAAPGFAVRSLTYGATNLLQQPLTVGATDTAELRVTVAAPAARGDDDVEVIIGPVIPLTVTPDVR